MMLFRAGTIPWLFHDHFDLSIDFCFWVLEADGLHVAPFDAHTGGDGTLQAAGLNAASWQAWTHEVISVLNQRKCTWHYRAAHQAKDRWISLQETTSQEERQSEAFRHIHLASLQQINLDLLPAFVAYPFFPVDFWKGNPEVGKRLGELWDQYPSRQHQRDVHARKDRQEHLNGEWKLVSPSGDPHPLSQRNTPEGEVHISDVWRALEPYHSHLEGLILSYIDYPQQIDYLVPPLSVVLTLVDGKLDYKDILPRVVQVAERLVMDTPSS